MGWDVKVWTVGFSKGRLKQNTDVTVKAAIHPQQGVDPVICLVQGWKRGKGCFSQTRHTYPYHPCVDYLSTFTIKNQPNVGKYIMHGWYGIQGPLIHVKYATQKPEDWQWWICSGNRATILPEKRYTCETRLPLIVLQISISNCTDIDDIAWSDMIRLVFNHDLPSSNVQPQMIKVVHVYRYT